MQNRRLLSIGIVGTAVAALCCFTPLLVVVLGALGLGAALAWLDLVLLPALAVFAAITGFALWRLRKERRACSPGSTAR